MADMIYGQIPIKNVRSSKVVLGKRRVLAFSIW